MSKNVEESNYMVITGKFLVGAGGRHNAPTYMFVHIRFQLLISYNFNA